MRRKSHKSIAGLGQISPIKEECQSFWKDHSQISEGIHQKSISDPPNHEHSIHQKRVSTCQMSKPAYSVPTNKLRKSYRKNTTEV